MTDIRVSPDGESFTIGDTESLAALSDALCDELVRGAAMLTKIGAALDSGTPLQVDGDGELWILLHAAQEMSKNGDGGHRHLAEPLEKAFIDLANARTLRATADRKGEDDAPARG